MRTIFSNPKLFKIVDYLTFVENCVFLAVFLCFSPC